METLVFEPVVPLRWLAAGWAALGAAVIGYALWRPHAAGRLRGLALAAGHALVPAAMLVLLHGPTWVELRPQGGRKPDLLVLTDRSASMSAEASAGAAGTRYAGAAALVGRHRAEWSRIFTLRSAAFDRSVRPGDPAPGAEPDGAMTDLAAAIDEGVGGGTPPAAILLLSDGIHNAGDSDPVEAARRARAVQCPVFAVTLGSDAAVKDLGIVLAQNEGLTFIRQPYRVLAKLVHRGFEGAEARVSVRLGGKAVEERRVPITGPGDVNLDLLLVQEKAGLYEYEIAVGERPGEVFRSNNRQRLVLRVVDERIRVLVLEGKPYWDSKFLLQALRRDANVAVSSVARVTAARSYWDASSKALAPKDPARPLEDRAFLDACQVVVLGRDVECFLTPAAVDNLREWISGRGGHLVAARGRPVGMRAAQDRLLALMPLEWTEDEERRFRLELTERGRLAALFSVSSRDASGAAAKAEDDPRVLLRSLPALVTATRVEKERALSVVLARGSGPGTVAEMATLTFQQYGAGRVVVLEGQGLWRWAFQPPESAAAARAVFDGFWTNLIRWLVGSNDFLPSQLMALRVAKPTFLLDERPVLYVLQRAPAGGAPEGAPPAPVLEVLREEGAAEEEGAVKFPIRVEAAPVPGDPSLRRAVLDPLPAGRYRVRLLPAPDATSAAGEAAFEVTPPLQERLDLRARPETMRLIAKTSDGEDLSADQAGRLREAYSRYVARFRPDLEVRTPAWDRAWIWMLLMGWLAVLWYRRRRWGMI